MSNSVSECREIIEIRELGIGKPEMGNPGRQRWMIVFNAKARNDGRLVQVWHAWREDNRENAIEKVRAYHRNDYDEIDVRHSCAIQGSES